MSEDEPPLVQLGKHVLDKGILDRDGLRCGKVDDLVLELSDDGSGPAVVALVTGPTAFARTVGPRATWLARLCYRVIGVRDIGPVEVAWDHVAAIDVLVHLDCDSERTRLQSAADAARRIIDLLPGSG
jgi:sporulation protein YlmC with PRC-barrel domain